jgi:hypothetical protein
MYKVSLNSCWAKVNRAKQHRDALEAYIGETFSIKANLPTLGAKFDTESREHIVYINHVPDLGPFLDNVALFIGDVVHNLRCALDHLAFQLARGESLAPKQQRKVQFPIFDKEEDFHRKCYLGDIAPEHRKIIEELQPYHGLAGRPDSWSGSYIHQLALLRDLDNMDKHRMLTPILAVPWSSQFFSLTDSLRTIINQGLNQHVESLMSGQTPHLGSDRLEVGSVVLRAAIPRRILEQEVNMAGYVTPMIHLPDGRPLIPTLDRLAAFVVYILHEFEPLF